MRSSTVAHRRPPVKGRSRNGNRPRTLPLVFGLAGGLAGGLANGLVVGLGNRLAGGLADRLAGGLQGGLIGGLGGALLFGLGGALAARSWARQPPGFADFHLAERLRLLIRLIALYGLGTGLLLGLWNGLGAVLLTGLGAEFVAASSGGLTLGLAIGAGLGAIAWAGTPTPQGRARTPMTSWRTDRTLNLARSIVGGVALTAGLSIGVLARAGDGHTIEIMVIVASALGLGLVLGLGVGRHHAWTAYRVASYRLARDGRMPRRLMPFLDDAHRLGLLRAVGPHYQFRHAEFQAHLAARHDDELQRS